VTVVSVVRNVIGLLVEVAIVVVIPVNGDVIASERGRGSRKNAGGEEDENGTHWFHDGIGFADYDETITAFVQRLILVLQLAA
jgi:hypothetical protein